MSVGRVLATPAPEVAPETGSRFVPQYRSLPCPTCHNRAFSFLPDGRRQCASPAGCGYAWDPGKGGREVVGWRESKA
jgi:hypothetical protein